jgi:hypothetical protein
MVRGRCAAALALSALAGGCFIVPETQQHEIRRYTHQSDVKTTRARPSLHVRTEGRFLDVQADWRRTCTVWNSEIVEYRVETTAGLDGLDNMGSCSGDCGYFVVGILVLAPITLLISGIITGIIVSGSHDTTRREVESQTPVSNRCDAPGAGFQVRASVRGQPDVAAITDTEGRARLVLPDPTAATAAQPIVIRTDNPRGVKPVVIRRGPPGAR